MRDLLRLAMEETNADITQASDVVEVPVGEPVVAAPEVTEPAADAAIKTSTEDLEADKSVKEEESVVMKGPLSEVYARALDIVYSKDNEADEEVKEGAALESQANDVLMMKKLAASVASSAKNTAPHATVYGVSANHVTTQEIVELTQELTAQENPEKVVLIVDATNPGPDSQDVGEPTEEVRILSSAMESIVLAHGGKVFRSLEEFAQSR